VRGGSWDSDARYVRASKRRRWFQKAYAWSLRILPKVGESSRSLTGLRSARAWSPRPSNCRGTWWTHAGSPGAAVREVRLAPGYPLQSRGSKTSSRISPPEYPVTTIISNPFRYLPEFVTNPRSTIKVGASLLEPFPTGTAYRPATRAPAPRQTHSNWLRSASSYAVRITMLELPLRSGIVLNWLRFDKSFNPIPTRPPHTRQPSHIWLTGASPRTVRLSPNWLRSANLPRVLSARSSSGRIRTGVAFCVRSESVLDKVSAFSG
jgi:hypothetical protein